METIDHIAIIIAKELKGEASSLELQELQQWLEAAPSNKSEHELLVQVWQKIPALIGHPIDTNAAWAHLEQRIAASKKKERPVISPLFKRMMAAAAVLVLAITAWYIIKTDR